MYGSKVNKTKKKHSKVLFIFFNTHLLGVYYVPQNMLDLEYNHEYDVVGIQCILNKKYITLSSLTICFSQYHMGHLGHCLI